MRVTNKYQLNIGDNVVCKFGNKQINGTVIDYGYRSIGVQFQNTELGYNNPGTMSIEVRNYKKDNKVAGTLGHVDHKYSNQIIVLETI